MLIRIELKPRTIFWLASSNVPHILVHGWSWQLKQEERMSIGIFCLCWNSSFWCRRTIIAGFVGMRQKRRLIHFYFISPNSSLHYDWEWEKQVLTSSSGLFGSEHTVLCFVVIRYLSVWCAIYLELFGYKVRRMLFFSNPAGNGMEEKNEPPIIQTLRGREDVLITENNRMCSEGKRLQYCLAGRHCWVSITKYPSFVWIFS